MTLKDNEKHKTNGDTLDISFCSSHAVKQNQSQGRISRSATTRLQLLRIKHEEYRISTARNIALVILRDIKDTPKRRRDKPEFVNEIRRKLLILHDYNCKTTQVKGKFPYSKQFILVLLRYVQLEHETLYSPKNYNIEYEKEVERRVLCLLEVMLNDATEKFGYKNTIHATSKCVLRVLNKVNLEYRTEDKFVGILIIKLLKKLGLLDEITKIKDSKGAQSLESLLHNPTVQLLSTSNIDDLSDCDSEDSIEVSPYCESSICKDESVSNPIIKREIKTLISEELKVENINKVLTIEVIHDDFHDEDLLMMYKFPEAKSKTKLKTSNQVRSEDDKFSFLDFLDEKKPDVADDFVNSDVQVNDWIISDNEANKSTNNDHDLKLSNCNISVVHKSVNNIETSDIVVIDDDDDDNDIQIVDDKSSIKLNSSVNLKIQSALLPTVNPPMLNVVDISDDEEALLVTDNHADCVISVDDEDDILNKFNDLSVPSLVRHESAKGCDNQVNEISSSEIFDTENDDSSIHVNEAVNYQENYRVNQTERFISITSSVQDVPYSNIEITSTTGRSYERQVIDDSYNKSFRPRKKINWNSSYDFGECSNSGRSTNVEDTNLLESDESFCQDIVGEHNDKNPKYNVPFTELQDHSARFQPDTGSVKDRLNYDKHLSSYNSNINQGKKGLVTELSDNEIDRNVDLSCKDNAMISKIGNDASSSAILMTKQTTDSIDKGAFDTVSKSKEYVNYAQKSDTEAVKNIEECSEISLAFTSNESNYTELDNVKKILDVDIEKVTESMAQCSVIESSDCKKKYNGDLSLETNHVNVNKQIDITEHSSNGCIIDENCHISEKCCIGTHTKIDKLNREISIVDEDLQDKKENFEYQTEGENIVIQDDNIISKQSTTENKSKLSEHDSFDYQKVTDLPATILEEQTDLYLENVNDKESTNSHLETTLEFLEIDNEVVISDDCDIVQNSKQDQCQVDFVVYYENEEIFEEHVHMSDTSDVGCIEEVVITDQIDDNVDLDDSYNYYESTEKDICSIKSLNSETSVNCDNNSSTSTETNNTDQELSNMTVVDNISNSILSLNTECMVQSVKPQLTIDVDKKLQTEQENNEKLECASLTESAISYDTDIKELTNTVDIDQVRKTEITSSLQNEINETVGTLSDPICTFQSHIQDEIPDGNVSDKMKQKQYNGNECHNNMLRANNTDLTVPGKIIENDNDCDKSTSEECLVNETSSKSPIQDLKQNSNSLYIEECLNTIQKGNKGTKDVDMNQEMNIKNVPQNELDHNLAPINVLTTEKSEDKETKTILSNPKRANETKLRMQVKENDENLFSENIWLENDNDTSHVTKALPIQMTEVCGNVLSSEIGSMDDKTGNGFISETSISEINPCSNNIIPAIINEDPEDNNKSGKTFEDDEIKSVINQKMESEIKTMQVKENNDNVMPEALSVKIMEKSDNILSNEIIDVTDGTTGKKIKNSTSPLGLTNGNIIPSDAIIKDDIIPAKIKILQNILLPVIDDMSDKVFKSETSFIKNPCNNNSENSVTKDVMLAVINEDAEDDNKNHNLTENFIKEKTSKDKIIEVTNKILSTEIIDNMDGKNDKEIKCHSSVLGLTNDTSSNNISSNLPRKDDTILTIINEDATDTTKDQKMESGSISMIQDVELKEHKHIFPKEILTDKQVLYSNISTYEPIMETLTTNDGNKVDEIIGNIVTDENYVNEAEAQIVYEGYHETVYSDNITRFEDSVDEGRIDEVVINAECEEHAILAGETENCIEQADVCEEYNKTLRSNSDKCAVNVDEENKHYHNCSSEEENFKTITNENVDDGRQVCFRLLDKYDDIVGNTVDSKTTDTHDITVDIDTSCMNLTELSGKMMLYVNSPDKTEIAVTIDTETSYKHLGDYEVPLDKNVFNKDPTVTRAALSNLNTDVTNYNITEFSLQQSDISVNNTNDDMSEFGTNIIDTTSLNVLAKVAAEQETLEVKSKSLQDISRNENKQNRSRLKIPGKHFAARKIRSPKTPKQTETRKMLPRAAKQNAQIDYSNRLDNKRNTRKSLSKSNDSTKVSKNKTKCKPNEFKENVCHQPPNNIYAAENISEQDVLSEDSCDSFKGNLVIAEDAKHEQFTNVNFKSSTNDDMSIYDESTVEDGLVLINSKDLNLNDEINPIQISIPDTDDNNGVHYDILQEVEGINTCDTDKEYLKTQSWHENSWSNLKSENNFSKCLQNLDMKEKNLDNKNMLPKSENLATVSDVNEISNTFNEEYGQGENASNSSETSQDSDNSKINKPTDHSIENILNISPKKQCPKTSDMDTSKSNEDFVKSDEFESKPSCSSDCILQSGDATKVNTENEFQEKCKPLVEMQNDTHIFHDQLNFTPSEILQPDVHEIIQETLEVLTDCQIKESLNSRKMKNKNIKLKELTNNEMIVCEFKRDVNNQLPIRTKAALKSYEKTKFNPYVRISRIKDLEDFRIKYIKSLIKSDKTINDKMLTKSKMKNSKKVNNIDRHHILRSKSCEGNLKTMKKDRRHSLHVSVQTDVDRQCSKLLNMKVEKLLLCSNNKPLHSKSNENEQKHLEIDNDAKNKINRTKINNKEIRASEFNIEEISKNKILKKNIEDIVTKIKIHKIKSNTVIEENKSKLDETSRKEKKCRKRFTSPRKAKIDEQNKKEKETTLCNEDINKMQSTKIDFTKNTCNVVNKPVQLENESIVIKTNKEINLDEQLESETHNQEIDIECTESNVTDNINICKDANTKTNVTDICNINTCEDANKAPMHTEDKYVLTKMGEDIQISFDEETQKQETRKLNIQDEIHSIKSNVIENACDNIYKTCSPAECDNTIKENNEVQNLNEDTENKARKQITINDNLIESNKEETEINGCKVKRKNEIQSTEISLTKDACGLNKNSLQDSVNKKYENIQTNLIQEIKNDVREEMADNSNLNEENGQEKINVDVNPEDEIQPRTIKLTENMSVDTHTSPVKEINKKSEDVLTNFNKKTKSKLRKKRSLRGNLHDHNEKKKEINCNENHQRKIQLTEINLSENKCADAYDAQQTIDQVHVIKKCEVIQTGFEEKQNSEHSLSGEEIKNHESIKKSKLEFESENTDKNASVVITENNESVDVNSEFTNIVEKFDSIENKHILFNDLVETSECNLNIVDASLEKRSDNVLNAVTETETDKASTVKENQDTEYITMKGSNNISQEVNICKSADVLVEIDSIRSENKAMESWQDAEPESKIPLEVESESRISKNPPMKDSNEILSCTDIENNIDSVTSIQLSKSLNNESDKVASKDEILEKQNVKFSNETCDSETKNELNMVKEISENKSEDNVDNITAPSTDIEGERKFNEEQTIKCDLSQTGSNETTQVIKSEIGNAKIIQAVEKQLKQDNVLQDTSDNKSSLINNENNKTITSVDNKVEVGKAQDNSKSVLEIMPEGKKNQHSSTSSLDELLFDSKLKSIELEEKSRKRKLDTMPTIKIENLKLSVKNKLQKAELELKMKEKLMCSTNKSKKFKKNEVKPKQLRKRNQPLQQSNIIEYSKEESTLNKRNQTNYNLRTNPEISVESVLIHKTSLSHKPDIHHHMTTPLNKEKSYETSESSFEVQLQEGSKKNCTYKVSETMLKTEDHVDQIDNQTDMHKQNELSSCNKKIILCETSTVFQEGPNSQTLEVQTEVAHSIDKQEELSASADEIILNEANAAFQVHNNSQNILVETQVTYPTDKQEELSESSGKIILCDTKMVLQEDINPDNLQVQTAAYLTDKQEELSASTDKTIFCESNTTFEEDNNSQSLPVQPEAAYSTNKQEELSAYTDKMLLCDRNMVLQEDPDSLLVQTEVVCSTDKQEELSASTDKITFCETNTTLQEDNSQSLLVQPEAVYSTDKQEELSESTDKITFCETNTTLQEDNLQSLLVQPEAVYSTDKQEELSESTDKITFCETNTTLQEDNSQSLLVQPEAAYSTDKQEELSESTDKITCETNTTLQEDNLQSLLVQPEAAYSTDKQEELSESTDKITFCETNTTFQEDKNSQSLLVQPEAACSIDQQGVLCESTGKLILCETNMVEDTNSQSLLVQSKAACSTDTQEELFASTDKIICSTDTQDELSRSIGKLCETNTEDNTNTENLLVQPEAACSTDTPHELSESTDEIIFGETSTRLQEGSTQSLLIQSQADCSMDIQNELSSSIDNTVLCETNTVLQEDINSQSLTKTNEDVNDDEYILMQEGSHLHKTESHIEDEISETNSTMNNSSTEEIISESSISIKTENIYESESKNQSLINQNIKVDNLNNTEHTEDDNLIHKMLNNEFERNIRNDLEKEDLTTGLDSIESAVKNDTEMELDSQIIMDSMNICHATNIEGTSMDIDKSVTSNELTNNPKEVGLAVISKHTSLNIIEDQLEKSDSTTNDVECINRSNISMNMESELSLQPVSISDNIETDGIIFEEQEMSVISAIEPCRMSNFVDLSCSNVTSVENSDLSPISTSKSTVPIKSIISCSSDIDILENSIEVSDQKLSTGGISTLEISNKLSIQPNINTEILLNKDQLISEKYKNIDDNEMTLNQQNLITSTPTKILTSETDAIHEIENNICVPNSLPSPMRLVPLDVVSSSTLNIITSEMSTFDSSQILTSSVGLCNTQLTKSVSFVNELQVNNMEGGATSNKNFDTIDVDETPLTILKVLGTIQIGSGTSDHDYSLGGPLLSGKCENNDLNQSNNTLSNLKQANEKVSNEDLDNSPVDSENMFPFSEQVCIPSLMDNNLTQESSRSLDDSSEDSGNDYKLCEQDHQLNFSFIENQDVTHSLDDTVINQENAQICDLIEINLNQEQDNEEGNINSLINDFKSQGSYEYSQPTLMSIEKMNKLLHSNSQTDDINTAIASLNNVLTNTNEKIEKNKDSTYQNDDSTNLNECKVSSDNAFAVNSLVNLGVQSHSFPLANFALNDIEHICFTDVNETTLTPKVHSVDLQNNTITPEFSIDDSKQDSSITTPKKVKVKYNKHEFASTDNIFSEGDFNCVQTSPIDSIIDSNKSNKTAKITETCNRKTNKSNTEVTKATCNKPYMSTHRRLSMDLKVKILSDIKVKSPGKINKADGSAFAVRRNNKTPVSAPPKKKVVCQQVEVKCDLNEKPTLVTSKDSNSIQVADNNALPTIKAKNPSDSVSTTDNKINKQVTPKANIEDITKDKLNKLLDSISIGRAANDNFKQKATYITKSMNVQKSMYDLTEIKGNDKQPPKSIMETLKAANSFLKKQEVSVNETKIVNNKYDDIKSRQRKPTNKLIDNYSLEKLLRVEEDAKSKFDKSKNKIPVTVRKTTPTLKPDKKRKSFLEDEVSSDSLLYKRNRTKPKSLLDYNDSSSSDDITRQEKQRKYKGNEDERLNKIKRDVDTSDNDIISKSKKMKHESRLNSEESDALFDRLRQEYIINKLQDQNKEESKMNFHNLDDRKKEIARSVTDKKPSTESRKLDQLARAVNESAERSSEKQSGSKMNKLNASQLKSLPTQSTASYMHHSARENERHHNQYVDRTRHTDFRDKRREHLSGGSYRYPQPDQKYNSRGRSPISRHGSTNRRPCFSEPRQSESGQYSSSHNNRIQSRRDISVPSYLSYLSNIRIGNPRRPTASTNDHEWIDTISKYLPPPNVSFQSPDSRDNDGKRT